MLAKRSRLAVFIMRSPFKKKASQCDSKDKMVLFADPAYISKF